MITLNIQQFGGRGGSSGISGADHEYIKEVLDTMLNVDMGTAVNPQILALDNIYKNIINGEPFSPNDVEARIINGFIINYGLEGQNTLSYYQTLGLNSVQIQNVSRAAKLFRSYIKEKYVKTGYYQFAKDELAKTKAMIRGTKKRK